MNLKYSVVIILLVLIVISMRTEFNEEQSYCDKFSGQSSNASASEDYLSCENTAFCKTIKHQKSPSNTLDSLTGLFTFSCVHIDTDETAHPQKFQTLL